MTPKYKNNTNNTPKHYNAFTLIELLVVIAIIATLISILMPALNKARQQAKLVVCGSNQHELVVGLQVYMQDNDDKLPPSVSHVSGGNYHRPFELNWNFNSIGPSTRPIYTGKYLAHYLPSVNVFNCPLSTITDNTPWPPTTSGLAPVGTYGEFYTTGAYAPLHSTYMLLWNYQGYNFDVSSAVNKSLGNFAGPKTMSSKNKLVVQDSLFYMSGNKNILWSGPTYAWYSCHPSKDSTKATPYYVTPDTTGQLKPDVWLNAGYLDGSVKRFNSLDGIDVQNFSARAVITNEFQ